MNIRFSSAKSTIIGAQIVGYYEPTPFIWVERTIYDGFYIFSESKDCISRIWTNFMANDEIDMVHMDPYINSVYIAAYNNRMPVAKPSVSPKDAVIKKLLYGELIETESYHLEYNKEEDAYKIVPGPPKQVNE